MLLSFLTPRPRQLYATYNRIGPAVVDISASGHLVADGEYDLGKLLPTIVTDWAAPLFDGDLPLDVSIDIEPLDLAWAKLQLDTAGMRWNRALRGLAGPWRSSRSQGCAWRTNGAGHCQRA